MRAYKNFNKFDSDQPFGKWIATIANNHCLDLLRQKSRSGQIFGDEGQEMANLVSSDQPLVAQAMAREDEASMNCHFARQVPYPAHSRLLQSGHLRRDC
jgi:DNA-directed RNA polymerase specialized sigma24 family protein